MNVCKYNKRANAYTPVVRQVVSKQGQVFFLRYARVGRRILLCALFPQAYQMNTGKPCWIAVKDVSWKALKFWLTQIATKH
jgi:hypothetical protein